MPRERVAPVICVPCRQGADWISKEPEDVPFAMELHAACTGCDCQHKAALQAAGKAVQR